MPAKRIPLRQRFDRMVAAEPACGCWLWLGHLNPDGYGKVRIGGRHIGAHRVSWMLHCGEIPDGLLVLHRCDNPACVNPDHLYVGTPSQNTMDSVRRGRWNPPAGDRSGVSPLSTADVVEIRRLHYGDSSASYKETACRFGVTPTAISAIVKGRTWRHLPLPGEPPGDGRKLRSGKLHDPATGRFTSARRRAPWMPPGGPGAKG